MGIKKAKSKEIKPFTAAALGVTPVQGARLVSLSAPKRSKQTLLLEGAPAQQAAQLVEKLKFEVRAI
jgi:electron transfer flavoprotein beta subunit